MEGMANRPLFANDYADWFVNVTDRAAGGLITLPMVHKLIYFAQAWYLANKNRTLFDEDFVAWLQGPTLKSVQDRFASFRYTAIPEIERTRLIKGEKLELTEGMQERYGRYSALGLKTLAKEAGEPWEQARMGSSAESHCGEIIPRDAIRRFYAQKLSVSRG